jgi:threonine dehydratase
MADIASTLPLEAASVQQVFDKLASSPRDGETGAPDFNIYFKCENYQRIGAFKARGAFSAVTHLIEVLGLDEVRRRGVVTHSSGGLHRIKPE